MNDKYYLKLNWKDVIVKILLIVLFLILLIWLIPTPELTQFNSRIFNENIEIMQDAARNHYTVNRLPESIGESTSMTLKEMEEQNLVLPFTDQNNNACDKENSFVQVTKIADDEYVLKTQLSCGEQTEYVLETIGCYDVCIDDDCTMSCKEEEVTKYEYKQAIDQTSTSYTCPSGYTLNGTKCTKNFEVDRITATAKYSEASKEIIDATLENDKDNIIYADPIKVEDGFDYVCPEGYILNGTSCYIYTDGQISSDGNTEYTCPAGYEMHGSTCYKITNATKNINSTCPSGYTLSSDKTQCYAVVGSVTSSQTQSCPSGYSPSGGSCVRTYGATSSVGGWVYKYSNTYTSPVSQYENSTEKRVLTNSEYRKTCGDCYTYAWYYTYSTYQRSTSYTCPSGGTLSGSTCYVYTNYITSTGASYCTAGSLVNGQCLDYKTPTVTTTYTCPAGSELQGDKCYTPGTKNLVCPDGYTEKDGKCYKEVEAEKEMNYTYLCPDGYSKLGSGEDTQCYRVLDEEVKYTCPSGYELEANKCVKTIDKQFLGYTCPAGYILKDTNKCVKYEKETINATSKTSNTTAYKYTWSKYEELAGWTATGKTKTETATICE